MRFTGETNEFLELKALSSPECDIFNNPEESSLTVLWFKGEKNKLRIDGKLYTFHKNQIVFLTEFHKIKVIEKEEINFLRFNRPFYCIIDHDSEVGCKGLLFFGASQLPIISIPEEEQNNFDTLWHMFMQEMESKDNLQIEMLQMMLKRYLILCARLFKKQSNSEDETVSDLVRDFNFLVESNFKTMHTVAEYADLLNKTPKSLSTIFYKLGTKTPLQYIQERRMLEARRLLHYTEMQVKEIAFEIGFEDVQTFSRFFKKNEGVSPSSFKKEILFTP